MLSINEIMTTDVYTLQDTDTVNAARTLMTEKNIRHVPIVDNDDRLVGLVTQRDILAATVSKLSNVGEDAREEFESTVPLKDVMTTNLSTIGEGANLRKAAMRLQQFKHGCLPVVTDGRLMGIVTDSDFVAVAINLLEQAEMSEPEEGIEEEEF